MTDGFRPLDLQKEVASVAERFECRAEDLMRDLEEHYRFSSFRLDDDRIYLTSSRGYAASYASRAPEAEWECLWADRRVDGSLLRFVTGLSAQEVRKQVEDGVWGGAVDAPG